jgi:hypothetical protein
VVHIKDKFVVEEVVVKFMQGETMGNAFHCVLV